PVTTSTRASAGAGWFERSTSITPRERTSAFCSSRGSERSPTRSASRWTSCSARPRTPARPRTDWRREMPLTDDQLTHFRRYGVAFPLRVLSAEQAARYRRECDALELSLGGAPRTVEVRQMHLHFRWAYELWGSPNVRDAHERVLGPNLLVWATELFAKREHDRNLFIAWHRDGPYMGFDPAHTVTAWISLARSFRDNGCLQVVLEEDRAG